MSNVYWIREQFLNAYKNRDFTIDRNGSKTIELIGANFKANEEAIFGTVNEAYVDAEIEWYRNQSTNINDIPYGVEPPKAWQMTANANGEINSNYGHLIWSEKYHNQMHQVVIELIKNPDSRRATMIYNRPSIWVEFNDNGKNDFICTNSVAYYIRDNKLHCVVQMRSNDAVFGYKNDYAWQRYVQERVVAELYDCYPDLVTGDIQWQVQNLHVYERHFNLIKHK